jgi:transcriptional regulator with GAF, ATPase, and Fis domain
MSTDDGASGLGREQRVAAAFVTLADTMVADFDVIDFLAALTEHCVELLEVAAAGILLVDQRGALRVAAASSEAARLLEVFELEADQGPCGECCRTGQRVSEPDVTEASARWPAFAARAGAAGYRAVHALPMRLRGEVIGALNLFHGEPGELQPTQIVLAQALGDVATIGILQQRAIRERELLAEQLQTALNSRIVLEQAKGVVAERTGLDMDTAFTLLRAAARSRQRRLSDLARDVVTGAAQLDDFALSRPQSERPQPKQDRRSPGPAGDPFA